MHTESIERWLHDHTFGQDATRPGEKRTIAVIAITAVMMVVELVAGAAFGSMALLADGLHMGSHASALTVSALAYYYTRRHSKDARFSFGTGKMNSLAGFASAVLLGAFALVMAWESCLRFLSPVAIEFDQAILVAVVGLLVNGACLFVLGGDHGHEDEHDLDDHHHHHDHNLWSAYLHVLADALTSVLAIVALFTGKRYGWVWMDPVMGVVGAFVITRWSWDLIRASSGVLLDLQAPDGVRDRIRGAIERGGDERVTDLHVWSVGPGIFAAELGLVAASPREPSEYAALLPKELKLVHVSIQVQRCPPRHSN